MNISTDKSWLDKLLLCSRELKIELNLHQAQQCLLHCQEVLRWNRVHNLTSITDLNKMLALHVIDSLSVSNFIQHSMVLDVGTGAGFPGVPLSIAHPDKTFLLLDSNQKKITFLKQLIYQLQLKNCFCFHQRIEQFDFKKFHNDLVPATFIARAFSELELFLNLIQHLLVPGSQIILMKGKNPEHEVKHLPKDFSLKIIKLDISLIQQERHLILLTKV